MSDADSISLDAFVGALAASAPTPGGGAASALAGALAAALGEMVGQLTVGKARYREVEPEVRRLLDALAERRGALLRLMDEDAAAYGRVAAAYALARGSEGERAARDAAVQAALVGAIEPPRQIGSAALEVVRLAGSIAEIGNPNVASDAGCAALLGEAAVRCATLNVLANVVLLRDRDAGARARADAEARDAEAATLRERALAVVAARMGA